MAECNVSASRGQFAPRCVFFLTFVQKCRHTVGPAGVDRAGVPPCATAPSITAAVVCLRIIKDGGAWKVNDKTVCWTRVLFQSLARSFCPSRQLRFRGFSSLNYGETNTAALCNIPSGVSNESRGRGFTSSCKTFVPRACCGRAAGDQRLVYPFTIRC